MLDPSQPGGWGSRTPNHFELTELGRRSLLTKLADTQDDNAEVWEGLPGFQWYAPVLRAKAGSDVLCVHKDASNEYGRLPLLVTRTFGAGKVLFMGTDGAWRWRKGVEDKYHYRFWGQVVRWMAYQRNMAKGETMRLYYVPDQPRMHQTLALHANVMDRSGEPLRGGDVSARITSPRRARSELVRFASDGDEWGDFTGRLHGRGAGQAQGDAVLQADRGDARDLVLRPGRGGRAARPAGAAGGARGDRPRDRRQGHRAVEAGPRSSALWPSCPTRPPSVRRVQLW